MYSRDCSSHCYPILVIPIATSQLYLHTYNTYLRTYSRVAYLYVYR